MRRRRGEKAQAPMYEVRRWQTESAHVRGTTRTTAPSSCEAAAHVRSTTYDVRFGEFPRLRASLAPSGAYVRSTTGADKVCPCTRYDVRCTIAIIARRWRGDFCEANAKRHVLELCAECGAAFVVASPAGLCYNPAAGSAKAGDIRK